MQEREKSMPGAHVFDYFLKKADVLPHPLMLIIFCFLLIAGGTAAMMPLFIFSAIPLMGYLLFYAFFMAGYMLFICPPAVLILYILHTLFPASSLVDAILNISFHLMLIPIMLGGMAVIPLSFPLIGISMLMVGWIILSFKIAVALFSGFSANMMKDLYFQKQNRRYLNA